MSPPANILLVNHTSSISGAERGLLDLATGLDRTRFTPIVVLPAPGELSEALEAQDVPVRFLPMRRFKRTLCPLCLTSHLLNLLRVQRDLQHIISEESVQLVHANSNIAHIYAGRAATLAGIPAIWHSRDLVDLGLLGRWMTRHATRIIATSRTVGDYLLDQLPPNNGLTVIRNAVNLNMFTPADRRPAARKELGVDDDTMLMATIGQLVPWKRHPDFIEACALIAAEVPDAGFLVVGSDLFDDHPDYVDRLHSLAAARGLADRLTFTGRHSDMPALLEAVDLVIHPACREPFGRAVAEAMAMSRPVIAVNACGPAELIEDAVSGILVAPGNPSAIADAAVALARDPARAQAIGGAARARIETTFSLPGFIAGIQSLYEQLCNTPAQDSHKE